MIYLSFPRGRSIFYDIAVVGLLMISDVVSVSDLVGQAVAGELSAADVTLDTDCKTWHGGKFGDEAQCLIYQDDILKRQNDALDQQSRHLDQQSQQLDQQIASKEKLKSCLQQLKIYKDENPSDFEIFRTRFGKINASNACLAASRLKIR